MPSCDTAYERMGAVTFLWGVTLAVRKEVTGDKEGKEEKRGKRGK